MSTVRPFLPMNAPAPQTTRSLLSALTAIPTAPVTSPWTPQASAGSAPMIDTAAIEAEARERGRQQGLAETAELRDQLTKALAAFTTARSALATPAAMRIASAAAAVVGAWTDTAAPAELYGPIIHAWISKHEAPATAHVAPSHVDALKEMIQLAPIAVMADASMRHGDVRLSSATMEISHSWQERLPDLRDAIASALESS